MAAVEKACNDNVDIFVFGNAPTALFRLKELIKEGRANPKLNNSSTSRFCWSSRKQRKYG